MDKLFCYIIAISILSLTAISPAISQIKFDVTATSGKVTETVSEWGGSAKKTMDENATLQTLISYGKAAKEGVANLKELKEQADKTVDDVNASSNQIKDDATGVAGDATGEVGSVAGAATDKLGGAAAKAQSAQELLQIQNEKKELEAKINEEVATQQAEVSGKIKALEDNNANLQKMIKDSPAKKTEYDAMIVANDKQIADYNVSLKQISDSVGSQYSSQLADFETKISSIKAKASEDAMSSLSAGTDKLKGMLGDDATAEELNKVIAKNFVGADEPVNEENRKRIAANRKEAQVVDTIGALNTALSIKKGLDENNEATDKTKEKVDTSEGASTSVTMDIQLKIQNMKALVKYTKLLVADMKMRTANDMASLSRYKLRNPEKDVTQFNLDDYKYKSSECGKEKKKKGLSIDSVKETVKSAKGKMDDAKGYYKDATDLYEMGKDTYGEVSSSLENSSRNSNSSNSSSNSNNGNPSGVAEEIIAEEVIEDGGTLLLEEDETQEYVEKTEGAYEEEARNKAGQNPVDENAMMQNEYEKAAHEAGSQGVSANFKPTSKVGAKAELIDTAKSSSRTSFKAGAASSPAVATSAGEKK